MLETITFSKTDFLDQAKIYNLACGQVAVYTSKSPLKETHNEDSCAVFSLDEKSCVLVVADGMGGLPCGQEASNLVITSMEAVLQNTLNQEFGLRGVILNGLEQANAKICELGVGAGSTAAVVEIVENIARAYHIGDSKIIVIGQRGKTKLQTLSHSPTEYAVEAGYLDQDEAVAHEDRHYITNMLGSSEMRIEMGSPQKLAPFDTVIIGSDGLFDNMLLEEITQTIRTGPLVENVEALVKTCHERMNNPQEGLPSAADDLTIILFRIKR